MALDRPALAAMFQAGPGNPLVGLDGRVAMLRRLGETLHEHPTLFGLDGRPGLLFDTLAARAGERGWQPAVADVLALLLDAFSTIWPSGLSLHGRPLGDVWPHPDASTADADGAGLVPFHALTQWLACSLLEPLAWAGIAVDGLDALTGLPDHRNGGLLLDGGLIVPRQPRQLGKTMTPPRPGSSSGAR